MNQSKKNTKALEALACRNSKALVALADTTPIQQGCSNKRRLSDEELIKPDEEQLTLDANWETGPQSSPSGVDDDEDGGEGGTPTVSSGEKEQFHRSITHEQQLDEAAEHM